MQQKPDRRPGLTAVVAPVLAPGTGGFSARAVLDDRQVLNASICIDGKCYEGSMDLAPVIATVMAKVANYHTQLHATQVSGEVVLAEVDRVVQAAGESLVGDLVAHHVSVACAGWLDDIGSALKGAGVAAYRGVTETLQKFKKPITEAATKAATQYGGEEAGMATSQLVGPVIDSAANLGKDTPEKAAAEDQAQTDPGTAAALASAKEIAAHTIAAYHVADTAKQAADGHPGAQQQIAQVVQDAESGDPVAHAVAPIVANAFQGKIEARKLGQLTPGHATPAMYQKFALHAVARDLQKYQQKGAAGTILALGYVRYPGHGKGHQKTYAFQTLDEAQSWFGGLAPDQFVYAAVFDAHDLTKALTDSFGSKMFDTPAQPKISGEPWLSIVGASPWYTILGAAIDDVRARAMSLAAGNTANVVGVIHAADGLWHALPFANSDVADDWLGSATRDPGMYTYAAYFDKGDYSWPHPVNEKIGGVRTPAARGAAVPREVATVSGLPWYRFR